MADDYPNGHYVMSVRIFPADLNPEETVFGGMILSNVDKTGSVVSRRFTKGKRTSLLSIYTEIKKPGYLGDVLNFEGNVVAVGETTFVIHITIDSQTLNQELTPTHIGDAVLIESRIDDDGNNIKIREELSKNVKSTMDESVAKMIKTTMNNLLSNVPKNNL